MRHCHSRYAAGSGRPKWTAFAAVLKGPSKIEAIRKIFPTTEFQTADGAGRISLAMRAVAVTPSRTECDAQEQAVISLLTAASFGA